jgi:hypothetical protein
MTVYLRNLVCSLLLLFPTFILGQENHHSTDATSSVTSKENWKNALPQEKVYLHLDNTGYFKGETIWFKAYVVRTDTEKLGNLSSVLYVELVSPKGDVVTRKKLYVTHGIGAGNIVLDNAILPSGFYEIRAYTRYMTNWSKNSCFSRIIPIFKEPRKEGDYTPRIETPTQLTASETGKEIKKEFYPEGGYLVKGLPCRLAYSIKGKRGVVEIPASADHKTVQIDLNGSAHTYNLPEALEEGISLRVDALRNDSLGIDIWATDGIAGKDLGYALIHSGKILTWQLFRTQGNQHFSLTRDILPDGVSQITVFDPEGGALADRFVFRCPEYPDSLQITSPTTKILPCGKISMDITSTPYTSLSFSALDANSTVNGKQGDIKTWMLLGSDIRGYIANPEYYFESDDAAHRKDADLLMMIQGWRRYDWDLMSGYKKLESPQPYESVLAIDGQLHLKKKKAKIPVAGVKVSATLRDGTEVHGASAVTDSTGHYVMVLPDLQGEWGLSISAYDKKTISDKYIIPINRHFAPEARHPEAFEIKQIPLDNLQVHHWDLPAEDEEIWKKFLNAKGTVLHEVTVKSRRRDNFSYGGFKDERDARIGSSIYYDCEKAVEEILDKGEEPPTLATWLMEKNKIFRGGDAVTQALWAAAPDKDMTEEEQKEGLEGRIIDIPILQQMPHPFNQYDTHAPLYWIPVWRDGLAIGGGPLIWIVNNLFCTITNLDAERIFTTTRLRRTTSEYPELLEDVKSVYITKDDNLAQRITMSTEIAARNPYIIYCFTRENQVMYKKKGITKGIRYTSFQGYDPVEVFETEDYNVMPPSNDFRRTLYWNPNIWTDENGKAHVEFWNNSTCTNIIISAEGVTNDGKYVIGR